MFTHINMGLNFNNLMNVNDNLYLKLYNSQNTYMSGTGVELNCYGGI